MQILDWISGSSMHIPPWEAFVRSARGRDRRRGRRLRPRAAQQAGWSAHAHPDFAGSGLFTLITFELHHDVTSSDASTTADPIRIIEAVTAGVAFLAAGAIIQSRGNVRGLTTGANMWLAGALGVACGAGDYTLAAFGAVFAVIVLVVLGRLEAMARKGASDKDSDRS